MPELGWGNLADISARVDGRGGELYHASEDAMPCRNAHG
jgi:hypothetical protein